MPTVRFVERYLLSRPVVFAFFRRPANVVAVAPPGLVVRLVEGPDEVTAGAQFTVEVRRWGLTQRMVTAVTALEEPARIVEEQRQGPFRRWRLERVLTETAGHTELVETIDFEPPGGLLGLAVTPAVVERELAHAYAERVARVLGRMSNEGTPCASSTSPRR
jgi:ligand-binding SRPBCC domain-containing protein